LLFVMIKQLKYTIVAAFQQLLPCSNSENI